MKKRILALILVTAMVFTLVAIPTAAATATSGTCGDNLTWALDNDGTLTISGTGDMWDWDSYDAAPYDAAPWSSDNSSIKAVIIADGVTSIGERAFYGCGALTGVVIPEGITSIGAVAFGICDSLTNITVSENNKNYSSDSNGVLYNKEKTQLIAYPCGKTDESFVIPDSVTSIGEGAFFYCDGLTSMVIPEGVESIGVGAFEWCTNLASVIIPDSTKTIGRAAFYMCYGLTNAIIGNGVESIGESAFYSSGLTDVVIGGGVKTIDEWAFDYCFSLTDVYYVGSKAEWKNIEIGSYNGYLKSATMHYNYPKHHITWKFDESTGTLTVSGTGSMPDWADEDIPWRKHKSSIKTIIIADGVTNIGKGAFDGCTSLTSVDIPSSVTGIGANAFKGCTALTHVDIPSSAENIGNYAFWDCTSLTSMVIPNGVKKIGVSAFSGCTGLVDAYISSSVKVIGERAFSSCYSLTDVYYAGSEETWRSINIAYSNNYLTNATIHYDYKIFMTITEDYIDVELQMSDEEKKDASLGKIILVLYNQSGEVEETRIHDFAEEVIFYGLDLTKGSAKVFVWESLETMRPLVKSATRSFFFEEA